MASKTVTISPAGAAAAGCSAACDSYYSGVKTYTGGHPRPGESGGSTLVTYTNYQLAAMSVAGWRFKGWNVTRQKYVTGGLDEHGNVRTDVVTETDHRYQSGPSPYPQDTTAIDYTWPGDLEEANPGYDWRRHTFKWEIISVEAQFEQESPPAHTDLLVNSSTIESPAKLVYDPATNLLVADY